VIAGYTGTQHRATYTCVGDTVNLASRIEKHTKVTGTPILIDHATREAIPDEMILESFGEITFQGKNVPVNIYSVQSNV